MRLAPNAKAKSPPLAATSGRYRCWRTSRPASAYRFAEGDRRILAGPNADPLADARILKRPDAITEGVREHGLDVVPMPLADRIYVLQGLPGVGPALATRLLNHLGSVERVVTADVSSLLQIRGVGPKRAAGIRKVVSEFGGVNSP